MLIELPAKTQIPPQPIKNCKRNPGEKNSPELEGGEVILNQLIQL